LQWTGGLGLIVAGIEVSEDNDWKKQRAATAGLGNVRVLVGYEEILKENKRFLSGQATLLDFFRSPRRTRVSLIVRVLVGY
jgi:hypothetical protein